MSLVFKYWVEFDENGDIKSLHKNKYDCESPCNEYLVKLIPIKRYVEEVKIKEEISKELQKEADEFKLKAKKLTTEIEKATKNLKNIRFK
jgi:hypothetical protein